MVATTLKTTKQKLSFGLFCKEIPLWHLYLGLKGKCLWIVTENPWNALASEGDPPMIGPLSTSLKGAGLAAPRVILFQDGRPSTTHPVWKEKEVELILWVGHSLRKHQKVPEGWQISRNKLGHAILGGVTNGVFVTWRAHRVESKLCSVKQPKHYSNTLRQVMDPTQTGTPCQIPDWSGPRSEAERQNSVDGLLDWKQRKTARVRTPTVFSKKHWVKRRLTGKELSQVLDLPGARLKGWNTEELDRVVDAAKVPGKVVTQMLTWTTKEPSSKKVRWRDQEDESKRCAETQSNPSEPDDNRVEETKTAHQTKRDRCERIRVDDPVKPEVKAEMGENHVEVKTVEDESRGCGVVEEPILQGSEPESTVSAKAVKADDAKVPTHLWDTRLMSEFPELDPQDPRVIRALRALRKGALGYWKRKVAKDFEVWFREEQRKEPSIDKNSEVWKIGRRAVGYAWCCSWWEWDHGSHLFFWRWPEFYRSEATIGIPPRFDSDPPLNQERQPPYQDETNRRLVQSKVGKVVYKGYIAKGYSDLAARILAFMFMFDVPKGPTDVRMVYDGSKSGLNNALWSPWFALPTVETMTRGILENGWCGDNDYGEQFLNFPLHPELQQYCGVDLSQLYPEEAKDNGGLVVGRWTRSAMGLKVSPYNAVQGALVCKRVILKDHANPDDPFHWESIVLNLPGSEGYDARLPWLYKVRKDGIVACDIHQYIDDLRITGALARLVWLASSKAAKTCAWLGLQDAARKRREPSQEPGAWAGATVSTDEEGVYQSVTQDRWEKTQAKVRWLGFQAGLWDDVSSKFLSKEKLTEERTKASSGTLCHKTAESHRGFLIYVSRTFKAMVPYLKGLHLTLDSWREGRDEDGWKSAQAHQAKYGQVDSRKAPKEVWMVPRFMEDMKALMALTKQETPPKIRVRPKKSAAVFMVGDASGSGFGDSTWKQGSDDIHVSHGAWTKATAIESSNYREAYNLVLEIERKLKTGDIEAGSEIFVFTDNSTAERTFYKGSSKSRLLHELVLKLRMMEMTGHIICHFVWIPGTRMIAQGTDGLSRGDLTSGVMTGDSFLKYIPLNESAHERQGNLCRTLRDNGLGKWHIMNSSEEWFTLPFRWENREEGLIWSPPPCIADIALEQLCEAKHIFPQGKHMFVCPALMTGRWRKQLGKIADTMLTLPAGSTCWSVNQYEPIVVALICPFLSHSPWRVKRCEWVDVWEDQMRSVWRGTATLIGDRVREFWSKTDGGNGAVC